MNLTDELRKLADLRAEGSLTEEEFVEAKRRLLAGAGQPVESTPTEEDPSLDETYRSSRWSAGNLFFPDSLTLSADSLRFCKRGLVGAREERISYKAIASLRVTSGLFLANLSVETSGGSQPIFINGLWKSDARKIEESIRARQRAN
ncbi:MAG TPA: SHOCT domain-containing protein [Opitutaceae bacterium]|nr:SHOCT domain-containing protein [Opitutaceae bacterium]